MPYKVQQKCQFASLEKQGVPDGIVWKDIIDLKMSEGKSRSVSRIFMTEEDASTFISKIKKEGTEFQIVEI